LLSGFAGRCDVVERGVLGLAPLKVALHPVLNQSVQVG
jgi:hypothetical protein